VGQAMKGAAENIVANRMVIFARPTTLAFTCATPVGARDWSWLLPPLGLHVSARIAC
jgi:hypothetical protein